MFVPSLNAFFVIGGEGNYYVYNDIWAVDFNTDPPRWRKVVPENTGPEPFYNARAFYDEPFSRAVIVGGVVKESATAPESPLSNPWMLTFSPNWTARWLKLKPGGTEPTLGKRGEYDCVVPDPVSRRVFFFSSNEDKLYMLTF